MISVHIGGQNAKPHIFVRDVVDFLSYFQFVFLRIAQGNFLNTHPVYFFALERSLSDPEFRPLKSLN